MVFVRVVYGLRQGTHSYTGGVNQNRFAIIDASGLFSFLGHHLEMGKTGLDLLVFSSSILFLARPSISSNSNIKSYVKSNCSIRLQRFFGYFNNFSSTWRNELLKWTSRFAEACLCDCLSDMNFIFNLTFLSPLLSCSHFFSRNRTFVPFTVPCASYCAFR